MKTHNSISKDKFNLAVKASDHHKKHQQLKLELIEAQKLIKNKPLDLK